MKSDLFSIPKMNELLGKVKWFLVSVAPTKYRLPILYQSQMLKDSCENELRHLDKILAGKKVAIDVGVYEGWFSYAMSRLFSKVYSFEINTGIAKYLTDCELKNVELIDIGLSSSTQDATLYIPLVNGKPQFGWASLEPGNHPGADNHIEKPVKIQPLDSFGIKEVDFIKIDVEGHELEVLQGARKTISSNMPVILVEIKDQNIVCVTEFLTEIGYQRRQLEELIGIKGSRENYIFTPQQAIV
jgi:FkbM family methyltransferase